MKKVMGVIPARLASTRLKEKVLKPIAGKPMIQHVWERAKKASKLSDVIIACDDPRVETCARSFGASVMMTGVDHPNGSSRVAEVAGRCEADVLINIQGDEPMIHPDAIDRLADVFDRIPDCQVATLAVRHHDAQMQINPNVVKVVTGADGKALYFSRSPIPYFREPLESGREFLKHLGIYGYRKTFLLEFVRWPKGRLEEAEKLEQLRILEQGTAIQIVETEYDSWSVDIQDDLELVESKIKKG